MLNRKTMNTIIKESLQVLGGKVFVKFNWSAPLVDLYYIIFIKCYFNKLIYLIDITISYTQDAAWINSGSLSCSTVGDIYLLLKASDRINNNIELLANVNNDIEIKSNIDYTLILKKWANLHPSMGFRCFVKENTLIGIKI